VCGRTIVPQAILAGVAVSTGQACGTADTANPGVIGVATALGR
jgi:hypothetical protein